MKQALTLTAAGLVLCAASAFGQTQIQDLYYAPNGQYAQGSIYITNTAFTTATGTPVAAASVVVPITNGVVGVTLYPTVGASPTTTYTVSWSITNSNLSWTESWNVPASVTPVRVQQVRLGSTVSITLGQINATGLTVGDCLEVATGPVIAAVACGSGGISQLTGDVLAGPGTGSQAATVASVGGSAAANIHNAEIAANAATNADTPSTIVERDASGNFVAGTITAHLTGTASGNEVPLSFPSPLLRTGSTVTCPTASALQPGCLASADWSTFNSKQNALGFTPLNPGNNLSDVANAATARLNLGLSSAGGDLSGTYPNPTVATVGTSTAANVHTAELAANAATNLNTASTIVKRDASGNFLAGTITASLTGTASGNELPLTFTPPLNRAANTITCAPASSLQPGCLASADWSAFNAKQAAITLGTTLQYFRGDLSLATFPTALPPSGTAGGDLAGTFPDPTVAKVNGVAVPVSAAILGTNVSGQLIASTATITNNTTGNAGTATALAAVPSRCTAPAYSLGVLASGAAVCSSVLYAAAETASTTWSVLAATHGLGAQVIVQTFDSSGNVLHGNVLVDSSGNVTVSWVIAQAGKILISQ